MDVMKVSVKEPVGTISVSVIVRMVISLSGQKRRLHTYDYASLIVPTVEVFIVRGVAIRIMTVSVTL